MKYDVNELTKSNFEAVVRALQEIEEKVIGVKFVVKFYHSNVKFAKDTTFVKYSKHPY